MKSTTIAPAHNPVRPARFQPVGRSGLWTGIFSLALQAPLFACPVCFQIEDAQAASGVRAAVYVLMGVTVVVLGGFGIFFRRLFSGKP